MSWYYNHKGQLKGPFEHDKIQKLIDQGQLGQDDLIFEEGSRKWRVLSEDPEFAGFFKKSGFEFKKEQQEAWVFLRKNPKTGQRLQKGPYSTATIKTLIARGHLSLSDYIWRPGMKQWYRISVFDELLRPLGSVKDKTKSSFADKSEGVAVDSQSPDLDDTEELLKNVLILKAQDSPESIKEDVPPTKDLESTKAPEIDEHKLASFNDESSKLQKIESFKSKDTLKTKLTIAVLILLIGACFAYLLRDSWTAVQKWASQKAAVIMPVKENDDSEAKSSAQVLKKRAKTGLAAKAKKKKAKPTAPKAKAPARVAKKASYVRLKYFPKDLTLKVQTDGTQDYLLHFRSRVGQVLGAKSYYRVLRRKSPEIDLKSLPWPKGIYEAEVKIDGQSSKKTVFVGGTPKKYFQRLSAHKKSQSMDFMKEKVGLVKDSKKIMDLARKAIKVSSNAGLRSWVGQVRKTGSWTLRNIGPKSRNSYILAHQWIRLKGLRKELMALGRLDRSSSKYRLQAQKLYRSSIELHGEVQRLSLWK